MNGHSEFVLPRIRVSLASQVVGDVVAFTEGLLIFGNGLIIYVLYPGWEGRTYETYCTALLIHALLMVGSFYSVGLYKIGAIARPKRQRSKILLLYTSVFAFLVIAAYGFSISRWFSRVWAFAYYFSTVIFLYYYRLLVLKLLSWTAQSGRLTWNVAIVGAGTQGTRLVELFEQFRYPWIRIVGIFDERSSRRSDKLRKLSLTGNLEGLVDTARSNRIDEVLVAIPWEAEHRVSEILQKLMVLRADISLSPNLLTPNLLYKEFRNNIGLPVLNVSEKPLSGWDYVLKGIEDKALAALALIFLAPLMLLITALIKIDSPGPILFRQKRYGLNNQLIEVFKFRTMYVDQLDNNASHLTTRFDPRVTKLGRFLRRASLDELPQLFNVLKGEMSIVGPRPHATEAKAAGVLYQQLVGQYPVRHKVKPGITGWAQVNGWRGETDTEEKIFKRVEYDIAYINNWSLRLDLVIIWKTLWVVLKGENAY